MKLWHSLEVPRQGASDEYPHHNFFVEKYKRYISVKKHALSGAMINIDFMEHI